jgi:hypothetical protein
VLTAVVAQQFTVCIAITSHSSHNPQLSSSESIDYKVEDNELNGGNEGENVDACDLGETENS